MRHYEPKGLRDEPEMQDPEFRRNYLIRLYARILADLQHLTRDGRPNTLGVGWAMEILDLDTKLFTTVEALEKLKEEICPKT